MEAESRSDGLAGFALRTLDPRDLGAAWDLAIYVEEPDPCTSTPCRPDRQTPHNSLLQIMQSVFSLAPWHGERVRM